MSPAPKNIAPQNITPKNIVSSNIASKNIAPKNDKIIFFDTGPIISLVMARIIWILPHLKERFGGRFYITPAVHKELIERPLTIRRFEFEALQVLKLIKEGVLEIYDKVPQQKLVQIESLANTSFKIDDKAIDVVQAGELESVACVLELGAAAIVMDERTLRLFIENNEAMVMLLEERFNKKVVSDKVKINQFSQLFTNITIIRSVELIGVAYKLGLLNPYLPDMKQGKEILLDSLLWGAKYNGCAVTDDEVKELKEFLLK